MQTFIVRVFDAEDPETFAGWVEEPLTGLRTSFHAADGLLASLGCPRPSGVDAEPAGGVALERALPDGAGRSDHHQHNRRE